MPDDVPAALSAPARAAIDAISTQRLLNEDYERQLESRHGLEEDVGLLRPLQRLSSYSVTFWVDIETKRSVGTRVSVVPLGLSGFCRRALDVSRACRISVEVIQAPLGSNPFDSTLE